MKTYSMNPIFQTLGVLSLVVSPILAQEAKPEMKKEAMCETEMHGQTAEFTKLIAIVHSVGDSNVKGTVVFEKVDDGVKVIARIGGFEPNTKHGFHIHEFGDLGSSDATSAGGHFDPEGHDHALPEKQVRHAGDLGNLEADGEGNATLEMTVDKIMLGAGSHGILGRAVIIHAKEDDGGQPTGNAGARIGAGVIGISKDGTSTGN